MNNLECVKCKKKFGYKTKKQGLNGAFVYYFNETVVGIGKICMDCRNKKNRERYLKVKAARRNNANRYEKTLFGFVMRAYRNMQSRIKGIQKNKAHLYEGKELLDRETFYQWSLKNKNLTDLYENWVKNLYDRKLTPSIDRIDSSKGYFLDNMQWITHSENSRKGSKSKLRNKLIPTSTRV